MRKLGYVLFLGFVFSLSGCNSPQETKPLESISKSRLHSLHNQERQKHHCSDLIVDETLQTRAQLHAQKMARENNLKHSQLGGTLFFAEGENIAMGQISEEEVVLQWMESDGHRKNILNPRFTHIGFGVAMQEDGVIFWCVQFGSANQKPN